MNSGKWKRVADFSLRAWPDEFDDLTKGRPAVETAKMRRASLDQKVKVGDWLRKAEQAGTLTDRVNAVSVSHRIKQELGVDMGTKAILDCARAFGVEWSGGRRGPTRIDKLSQAQINLAVKTITLAIADLYTQLGAQPSKGFQSLVAKAQGHNPFAEDDSEDAVG